MTNQKSIESTYDYLDAIFKESICDQSWYFSQIWNGNLYRRLEKAPKAKTKFILKRIKFRRDDKKLSIGFIHIYNKIKPDEILLTFLIIFFWFDSVRRRLFS